MQKLVAFDLLGKLSSKFLPFVLLYGKTFLTGLMKTLRRYVVGFYQIWNILVTEIAFGAVLMLETKARVTLVVLIRVERAKDRRTNVALKSKHIFLFGFGVIEISRLIGTLNWRKSIFWGITYIFLHPSRDDLLR